MIYSPAFLYSENHRLGLWFSEYNQERLFIEETLFLCG